MLDTAMRKMILIAQRNEITEHFVYEKLAQSTKGPHNAEVLRRISRDELRHYGFWKKQTGEDVKPNKLKIWVYYLISKVFGVTFGIKLMEGGEELAHEKYLEISKAIPEAAAIASEEDEHERELIGLIDEELLRYVGSMVLGLSDALVELTGALAGLTLALQNTRLIAMTVLITGIAASLSMAASEYLSTKSEESDQDPLKAALYTGAAYVFTVMFLIFPYLTFANLYVCLGLTLLNAVIVILLFTFYISVAKDISFKERFSEMALLSLGVAAFSFGIGYLIRVFMGVDI